MTFRIYWNNTEGATPPVLCDILHQCMHKLNVSHANLLAHQTIHGDIKPGLYFSRWQSRGSMTVADSRAWVYSWRLSPAQVCDCRQQSSTVVFKVQQCWTFNAVASSRWHFPSSHSQRAATAFIRSWLMQTWRTHVIKHLKLQICVCHRRSDFKSHRKTGNLWKSIGVKIERDGKHRPTSTLDADI